jgi:uncharacterized membrane protein
MLHKVAKVHSNRFKVITNQFSYNQILIKFLQLVSIQILINFLELLEQVICNYILIQHVDCFNKSSHFNFLNLLSTIAAVNLGQQRN